MDCAAFKELVALFAMGALDGEERRACEAHLASEVAHEGCLEALDTAMETLTSLDRNPPLPMPRVWTAIARAIAPSAERLRRARRRVRLAVGIALACAAALLVAVLRDLRLERAGTAREAAILAERDTCLSKLELIDVLQLPGTKLYALAPEKGRTSSANVIIHTGIKRAYVVADGLPSVPDRDYEMWIAKGERVVAAGLVRADASGRAIIRIDYSSLLGGEAGAPDAMMITLEPRGGGDAVRGPTIVAGAIKT